MMQEKIEDIEEKLNDELGPTMVSVLSDILNHESLEKWAQGEDFSLKDDHIETRLRGAYEAWNLISQVASSNIARRWFTKDNTILGGYPIMALRYGRVQEVMYAAQVFADETSLR